MVTTTASAVNSLETTPSPVTADESLRQRYLSFIARHEAAWELTFAALAVVYVVVGFVEDSPATTAFDLLLTAIFAAEFASRLAASVDRKAYLRGHWIDALALIPVVRGIRVLRLLRLLRLVRAFAGVARALNTLEQVANHRPCRAFRPHAGWRSWSMYAGLKTIDHRLVGWSWMLWDWNWFKRRTADSVVDRVRDRIGNGDIVVMHDGDESAPLEDQRQTVDATARLVPELRAKGFVFGTVCP